MRCVDDAQKYAPADAASAAPVITIDESWYEKLGRWEEALEAYEIKKQSAPDDVGLLLGQMRCVTLCVVWLSGCLVVWLSI